MTLRQTEYEQGYAAGFAAAKAFAAAEQPTLTCGLFVFKVADRVISYNGIQLKFTPLQLRIMHALMQGNVVSDDALIQWVYPVNEPEYADNVIKVVICKMRSAIRKVSGVNNAIIRVRAFGYRLASDNNGSV